MSFKRLINQSERKDNEGEQETVQFEDLARVLRQSIYLLSSVSSQRSQRRSENGNKRFGIQKTSFERLNRVGFPLLSVDLSGFDLHKVVEKDNSKLVEKLNLLMKREDQSEKAAHLMQAFQSNFFQRFVKETLEVCYPVTRFAVLVAIWQVAAESGHREVGQIMAELVAELAHEEVNCATEEDLMRLTQLGSVWLSEQRSFRASAKSQPINEEPSEEDRFYAQDDDDDSTVDSHLQSGLDLRASLRRLIDVELLRARQCPVCGFESGELLSSVSSDSCLRCNRGAVERCSISYKPLQMLSLECLLWSHPKVSSFTLISASEWAQFMMRTSNQSSDEQDDNEETAEKLQVSSTFERLTFSDVDTSSQSEDGQSPEVDNYETVLSSFLRNLNEPIGGSSQSWLMHQHLRTKDQTSLLLCAEDIFVLNPNDELLDVRMQLNFGNLFASGSIWRCWTRSEISKLQLGCSRIFTSVELIRERLTDSLGEFLCPFCGLELIQMLSLSQVVG